MKKVLFFLLFLLSVAGLIADSIVFSGTTELSGPSTKFFFQLLEAKTNRIMSTGECTFDFRNSKYYEYSLDVDYSELDLETEYIQKVVGPENQVISEFVLEKEFYAYSAKSLGTSVFSENGRTVVQVGNKDRDFEIMSGTEPLLSAYSDKISFQKGMQVPNMTSTQRQVFLKNNQEEGLVVFDIDEKVLLISFFRQIDQKYIWKEIGAPEIGTITAWYPNFAVDGPDRGSFDPDKMSIPYGWALCDGARILDRDSILDRENTPNLISDGYFLRGSEEAGNFQEDSLKRHNHSSGTLTGTTSNDGEHTHTLTLEGRWGDRNLDDYPKWSADDGRRGPRSATTDSVGQHTHSVSISGSTDFAGDSIDTETRPKNMSVIWLIRIK